MDILKDLWILKENHMINNINNYGKNK